MLYRAVANGGRIDQEDELARLYLPAAQPAASAQFTDYRPPNQIKQPFTNGAPFRLQLHAAPSTETFQGSFGFGLWNDPIDDRGEQLDDLQCLWFVYGQPASAKPPALFAMCQQSDSRREIAAVAASSPAQWQRYEIDWRDNRAMFRVDGADCLLVSPITLGRLGLVIWASARGLTFQQDGLIAIKPLLTSKPQWLEVKSLHIGP